MQSLLFHSFLIILLNLSLLLLCHHSYCSHHIHLLLYHCSFAVIATQPCFTIALIAVIAPICGFTLLFPCSYCLSLPFFHSSSTTLWFLQFAWYSSFHHAFWFTSHSKKTSCDSSSKNTNPWTTIMKITPWMIHPSTITHSTTNDDTPPDNTNPPSCAHKSDDVAPEDNDADDNDLDCKHLATSHPLSHDQGNLVSMASDKQKNAGT